MQNVNLRHQNHFFYFLNLLVFFGFGLPSLSGCVTSRESMCQELPASSMEIASFKAELDSRSIGRRIASSTKVKEVRVAPDDTEVAAWMGWTERVLKRTQWARDALEGDKSGRKALPYLSEAGLSLVSLHGFLEQKKWHKAYSQLEKVEENLLKAGEFACIPLKPEADRQLSSEKNVKKKSSRRKQ